LGGIRCQDARQAGRLGGDARDRFHLVEVRLKR
jgi:hypothetical protein